MNDVPEDLSPVEAAFWSDVERKWSEKLKQRSRAIELCLGEDLWEPTAILIFSGIEAMAWLDRPTVKADSSRQDFLNWVDTYMLPGSGLPCTAEEMYGSRCGLVHSHTAESKAHRGGRIRKVFFHRSVKDKVPALFQLDLNEKFLPVSVDLDHMFWAFQRGIHRFTEVVNANAQKARMIGERINKSYLSQVSWLG